MKNCAFVAGTWSSSFQNRFVPLTRPSAKQPAHKHSKYNHQSRKRTRAKIVCNDKLEPVEGGVTLPQLPDTALQEESKWLSQQLIDWLDAEWQQGEPQPIHQQIGERTAQIYARQRMEGQDDLSSVLIAIGSELEGMDFSSAFVGPWSIANKTSELLLEHRAGPRVKLKPFVKDPNAPTWSKEMKEKRGSGSPQENQSKDGIQRKVPSPSLADRFEKMRFLCDVIDESVSKELVDGAIAAAVGFRYDAANGVWDGREVEDEHFRQFGDSPPDILGDESSGEFTDTLRYLEKQLGLDDDETGELAKGLDMVIETLHGTELTEIQSKDENDHAFHKRVVVAKWLHLVGGF